MSSCEKRTRASAAAPVPIHTCEPTNTAMFDPLAANAPSFGSAGGSPCESRVQVLPPFSVWSTTNCPSIESPIATPRSASTSVIAS